MPHPATSKAGRTPATASAAAALFLLLTGYYGLRPIRDELGVRIASSDLPWLFTATFLTSAALLCLVGSIGRRRGAVIILAFAISLALAAGLLASDSMAAWAARFLFVWITAWSYLLVGLFWRGVAVGPEGLGAAGSIAAGGSAGALAGPAMTAALADRLETPELMALCAALIVGAAGVCARAFAAAAREAETPGGEPAPSLSRSPLAAITGYIVLLQVTATLFYLQQLALVEAAIEDPAARTRFFALVDLGANGLALGAQLFIAPRLAGRRGLPMGLSITPVVAGSAFALVALWPSLASVAAGAAARRAMEYGVARPVREVVFALGPAVDRERYKLWVDAGLTRGGDLAGAWGAGLLASAGAGALLFGQLFAAAAMLAFGAWAASICARPIHGGRRP